MRFSFLLAGLGMIAAANAGDAADVPADERAALKALRGLTTNVQFHRSNGRVRLVRLSKPIVSDAALAPLKHFSRIDYLAVVSPRVTDAGLANIAELTELDTLLIRDAAVTDAGLKHLAKLTKLQRLYLVNTKITDAGLRHLAPLSNLTTLSLDGTRMTGSRFSQLKGLSKLRVLSLADTKTTDAVLGQLTAFPGLETLDLSGCSITGDGLPALKPLKKLQFLNLAGTNVTDATIAGVGPLKRLKRIELHRTAVTSQSIPLLKRLLPAAGISIPRATKEPAPFGARDATQTSVKAILPPIRERIARKDRVSPDFQRHVIPLLGRLGCNGRSCHGSFQGRGGFRLSMFGYDFALDHKNLAARIDRKSAGKSLILNKPTLKDDHGGGLRLRPGGWEQQLLHRWILTGAASVPKNAPRFVRLDVTPAEIVFQKADETRQLTAVAVWSDGTREDVTCLTRFESKDDGIANVRPGGLVRSTGKGDAHILAFYDNGLVAVPVMRPVGELTGPRYPAVPTPTKIDELVVAKLKKLGIRPSELCTDEEFLRRVSLDLIGTLPTPDEIRAFNTDRSSNKRAKKIDELLQRPAYVTWWTQRLCDLTGSNAGYLGSTEMAQPTAAQWQAWIERRVRDNVGWDKIVAGIVLASSRKPGQPYREFVATQSRFTSRKDPADFSALDNPMPHFWFRDNIRRPQDKALAFGYVFMGVRLDCAQCHKHPFDRWSKRDFELFTQFFTRIQVGAAPDAVEPRNRMREMLGVPVKLNTAALRRQSYLRIAAEGRPIPWKEVYIDPPRGKPHPAKLPGGDVLDLDHYADPRAPLMQWLRTEPNRYLARAFVNRIWASYFNTGIVDPPDDLNLANPPSNRPLLDHLVKEFIASGYDMRWLHKTIANSRTYQRSWRPNATNRNDERNFSRAVMRRLPAEVAVDAMIQATANAAVLARTAKSVRQRKIGQHPRSYQTRSIDFSLLIFGKSLRTTNCDCERQNDPTLLQALYVRNDQETIDRLDRPDGWLAALKRERPKRGDVDSLIQAAYLRTLSREPTRGELADCREHVGNSQSLVDGLRDVLWALLNTREFITNH